MADAVFLLSSLFIPGSDSTSCFDAADCNDDGGANVADAVYLLSSLFIPGSPDLPLPSGPECGVDPTADGLECREPGVCP